MKRAPFSSGRMCFAQNGEIILVVTTLYFICAHINLSLKIFLTIVAVQSLDLLQYVMQSLLPVLLAIATFPLH
jgi:hypothetical protein